MFDFLFRRKFIDPRQYTSGDVYILDKVVYDKNKYKELCRLVNPNSPNMPMRMVVGGARSILDTCNNHASKFQKLMVESTSVRDFFGYYDCIIRDYDRMQELEKYVYYGTMPSSISRCYLDQRFQIEIRHLIDRCYKNTEPRKRPALFRSFLDYRSYMDDATVNKLLKKFQKENYYGVLILCLKQIAKKKSE